MAEKKKPGANKKQISAKTRVKQSQASKKRRRGLKGTKQGGKFQGGVAPKQLSHIFDRSHVGLAGMNRVDYPDRPVDVSGDQGDRRFKGASPKETYRVHYEANFNRLFREQKGGLSRRQAESEAHRHAHQITEGLHNSSPPIEEMRQELGDEDMQVRNENPQEERQRVSDQKLWKTQRGAAIPGAGKPQGAVKHKIGQEPPNTVIGRLSPSHQEWLQEEFDKPGSPFYQAKGKGGDPGAKKRLRQYTDLIQENYGSDEAYMYVKNATERRGRPAGYAKAERDRRLQTSAQQDVEERIDKRSTGRTDKYASGAPSHEKFGYGVRVPGVDTEEALKKKHPDMSEADITRYRQAQRDAVDEWLVQNQRAAHEARQAALTGKTGAKAEPGDRVVFMTTNAGAPAPSVPANSLIGQYIIKKRKKMVADSKGAPRWELKGEFPDAVRDRHLIEISTGLTVGAQGRYGAYKDIGYRVGTKRSKGFGKQIPVGTKVLRDANNMPVYDDKGNIRYTEGYTRPFSVGTRDTGLRIYLG